MPKHDFTECRDTIKVSNTKVINSIKFPKKKPQNAKLLQLLFFKDKQIVMKFLTLLFFIVSKNEPKFYKMKGIIFLCLLFTTTLFSQEIEVITGRVINVKDGDSFTLLDDYNKFHEVRLAHVDCPEKKQAFGRKAQIFTFNFVFGKYVTVYVASSDRYHRKISRVEVEEQELNKALIRNGYAWHFKKYSKSEIHAKAELAARKEKSGLWIDAAAKAPWEFRKRKPKASIKK